MVEDGWEKLANDPSATAIVEKMARHYRRDSAVVEEIMDKVDQVIEASTPDEPLYVTCVRVYEEWRATKSKDAFQTLILIDDLRLYAKSRYLFGMPIELHPGTPPVRGLFWLARKRVVETTPDDPRDPHRPDYLAARRLGFPRAPLTLQATALTLRP